jgi:hypothetical protein
MHSIQLIVYTYFGNWVPKMWVCIPMGTRIYSHILTYNFRNHDEEYGNILNSLWLVAITFWCIGYGDIVPNTYCGRGICLIVGSSVRIIFEGGHPNLRIRFDQKSGAAIIFVSINGKCVYNWFSFIGFHTHCKPIHVMKPGFSLCNFSHREKLQRENPVLALYWLCTGLQCSFKIILILMLSFFIHYFYNTAW